MRKERPGALQKLLPIHGDLTEEELGLSSENKAKLQEEVSVVFHCGATLRLEAKLKDAIEMNTTGTWRILQLARGMKELKVCHLHVLNDVVCTYADFCLLYFTSVC